MSIFKSQNELAEELNTALANEALNPARSDVEVIKWMSTFTDRPCFYCGEDIANAHKPFMYGGYGDQPYLVMHQGCLLEWIYKLAPEMVQSAKELDVDAETLAFVLSERIMKEAA